MQYIALPVRVDAFTITHVGPVGSNGCMSVDTETDGSTEKTMRLATAEMLSRYTPQRGDYWVIQSDGYEYVNPKHVFERKYTPAGNLK